MDPNTRWEECDLPPCGGDDLIKGSLLSGNTGSSSTGEHSGFWLAVRCWTRCQAELKARSLVPFTLVVMHREAIQLREPLHACAQIGVPIAVIVVLAGVLLLLLARREKKRAENTLRDATTSRDVKVDFGL